MTGPAGTVLHASAVLVGDSGVLLRGPSGAGKSTLARELTQLGALFGRPAMLVGDDRIELSAEDGRLVARPVASIAGLIEVRGIGIARVPYASEAEIRLVVDVATERPPRLPDGADRRTAILAIPVSRIVVNGPHAAFTVLWRLGVSGDVFVTDR